MRTDAGVAPQMLYADGGPTRNDFLMQFTADVAKLPLVVSDVPESSALGAAMAGRLGLGYAGSLAELAATPRAMRTYRPKMDAARAHQLYTEWQAAVRRVL
jgi:glycerol kinase